jgi:5-(carboxyamino)imidazole ribonucleotide synthase
VVDEGPGAVGAVEAFAAVHGWPVMVKAARGGYDGKGVWPVADRSEAASVLAGVAGQIVVEELLPLQAELAVVVARRPSGSSAAWPAVETAQVGGVCREVLVPGRIEADVLEAASALGQKVAEIAGGVGVMAVELFWSGGRLLVNEVATRPHNSGHWTMEGAVTSQFENHVRAVLDLPLGATAPQHPQVASVNVFGGSDGADPADLLARGLAVEGAHVHLYGKRARPGRKLGHVTVCGDDAEAVRARAWSAAIALGTPVPEEIRLPTGVAR